MKNIKYIFLFVVILSLSKNKQCFGQNFADKTYYLIDSLNLKDLSKQDNQLLKESLTAYHKSKIDTERIATLNNICQNLVSEKWVSYQYFQYQEIQQALKDSKTTSETNKLESLNAGALNNIGFIYYNKSDFDNALSYYKKASKIYIKQGNKAGYATYLNNIGNIYYNKGQITKALNSFLRSLKIREKLKNKSDIAYSLNNVAGIYNIQGNYSNALAMYYKALKIRKKSGPKKSIASISINIGFIYKNQGDTLQAYNFFQNAANIQTEIGDKRGLAMSLSHIGLIYSHSGDPAIKSSKKESIKQGKIKAFKFYKRALFLNEELGNRDGISNMLYNIGMIELYNNNINKAEKDAHKGMLIAQETGTPALIQKLAKLLTQIFEKQKKGMQALKMHKLYIVMRDSIDNIKTQKTTIKQQAKYEYEKQKALDNVENEKLVAIEKEAKAKQKVITYAIGFGLVLVIAFLIFVFNRLRVTKKQKVVIEAQKEEVETQRDEIEEAHKEITDSINYAERIQRSFLASKDLLDENLKDYFVFFKPKEAVSGDFYWAGKLNNGNFAVVNADSTGHGVPGAIMSILNISSIEKAVEQNLTDPSEIFNATRKTIIERLKKDGSAEGGKDGMDASIISFDFVNQKFTYTAANNPIWVIRNKEVIIIKADKMPVGKHDNDSTPFSQGEFELQKGDVVYTITDGFQDQFGGKKGKKFMVKKLRNLLLSITHLPMQEQEDQLENIFFKWKGDEEQVDDICIIGVRV